jgi:hypothetical protein
VVKARLVPFASQSTNEKAVARYVIGVVILVGSLSLLRRLYVHQPAADYLAAGFFHSACNGIWISLGAPWLFHRLKL